MTGICLACGRASCLNYIDTTNKILSCEQCDAIFLENEVQDAFYDNMGYVESKIKNSLTRFMMVSASKIITSEYLSYLKEKTDMSFKNVLDIGSRFGTFVEQLDGIGIDAYGIEADKRNIQLAVTKKIQWTKFDITFKPNRKYDLICLTQDLYYMRDNYGVLKHVKEMLSDDGLVFIATFNPSSSLVREKLLRINQTNTNMVFSRKNFESLKEKVGLELIDYTILRSDFSNDMDVSKSKILTGLKYLLKLKKPYRSDPDGNHVFLLLRPLNGG